MKVLWFTNTPSLYDRGQHFYHGGGWIESLEQVLTNEKDIELGVSFFHAANSSRVKKNNTTYFPVKRRNLMRNPIQSILNNWTGVLLDSAYDKTFLSIINDFKPDLIHVFGTEGPFAAIQEQTDIPVIIHLQGLLNPYLNTYYPINQSRLNFLLSPRFFKKNVLGTSPAFGIKRFKNQAKREARILRKAQFVMGRTDWDKMIARLYNSAVTYFHVDEILREPFYQVSPCFNRKLEDKLFIVSTLSPTVYKGIDIVLKTALQLTKLSNFRFEWRIIGLDENNPILRHFELSERVSLQDVNLKCLGRKTPEELIALLNSADVFVHPSYIDNSPNSVCEAQIMGLPTIACHVGGLSSLIKHGESGFLVPSNGVFEIVHYLKKLYRDSSLAETIGQKAAAVATFRHDRAHILTDLKKTYKKILT